MQRFYIIFVKSDMFDHVRCLEENSTIDWWISPQPNMGDIYYIYKENEERIVAKTEVVRTQLKKADSKMNKYYDQSKLEQYIHPLGYNPLKCMRIKLVDFINKDTSFKMLSDEFGLNYPKLSNKQVDISRNRQLRLYLEE